MAPKPTYEELERQIDALKSAVERHKENREGLAEIFEMSLDLICVADINTSTFLKVNPAFTRVLGYSEEELLNRPFLDFVHPDDVASTLSVIDEKLKKGRKVLDFTNRYRCHDGTYRWLEWTSHPLPERGVTFAMAHDITERKRVKEALEKRLVALTLPPANTDRINFEDLFNLADIQDFQDQFADATGVASIITHPDGTPITRPSRFCRLCNDIIRKTDKGRANCYRSDAVIGRLCNKGPIIQPCMSGGLWDAGAGISVGGRHIANWLIGQVRDETQTEDKIRAYARKIGADEQETVEAFREVPAMPRHRFKKIAQALFTLAKQLSTSAYQNVQQARFITEHKRVEAELRKSESTLQSVFTATPVGICLMKNRVYQRANQNWCESFGYPEETLIGRTPEFLYESREEYERVGKRLYGQLKDGIASVYTRLKRSDGQFRDVVLIAKPLNPQDLRDGTVIVVHDFTERKRAETERRKLEDQLRQSQKMEAIGTLAGGIAHDFNNLLMSIQGRTSMILVDKDSSHPDFEHLREIERNIESAARLTKQLLSFARGGKYEVKPTDLNELIKNESRMFGRTRKEVTISEKYHDALWSVKVDRGQIQQVLLNLYVNAWQAMPGGGNLYIRTQNVILDEKYVKPHQVEPGPYVQISVTDTGIGMDKATQQRIFDPFFTTKDQGVGTGLGLASTYGIIKNHGGFIHVYSEKEHGSTFNLYLPAHEKGVMEKKAPDLEALGGSETVLFVDDEEMIAEVVENWLKRLGYNTLIALNGIEAVRIYEENKDRIDLVVLDMIMPNMSGGETFTKIKEIDPEAKVLLSSGYSINGQATQILNQGCNGFIQKPFKIKELSKKLRDILDS